MPTPRRRALRLSLVAAAIAALTAVAVQAPANADSASAVFPNGPAAEAPDYATTTFGDAWDFDQSTDLNLSPGPQMYLTSPSISGGVLGFAEKPRKGGGYLSLLWSGYPGALALGRDGTVASNDIDAATYTRLRLRIYSDQTINSSIIWFRGARLTQRGGTSFHIYKGWNDYDINLVTRKRNAALGGFAWGGKVQSLRIALNPTSTAHVKLDYARLYQPSPASVLTWQAPDASAPATLYWTETGNFNTASVAPVSGVATSDAVRDVSVACDPDAAPLKLSGAAHYDGSCTPAAAAGNTPQRIDVSGYPAGSTFFVVQNGAVVATTSLVSRPNPVVTAPVAAGCGTGGKQGAALVTFKASLFKKPGNAVAVSRGKDGSITATNGGKTKNDPQVQLNLAAKFPKGIPGKTWRYVTVTEGYQGAFNLGSTAGGGTMGRIVWQLKSKSKKTASQTNDIVTYAGKQVITVDMGQSTKTLLEPEAKTKYAYAASSNVSMLRWDPNEDPGSRRWTLYSVQLGQMCTVTSTQSFTVTWNDSGFTPGATANLVAFQGTRTNPVAAHVITTTPVPEVGLIGNSFAVSRALLGPGNWNIAVQVSNSATTSGPAVGYAATPIKVK